MRINFRAGQHVTVVCKKSGPIRSPSTKAIGTFGQLDELLARTITSLLHIFTFLNIVLDDELRSSSRRSRHNDIFVFMLSGNNTPSKAFKALPPLAKDDDLPPPPFSPEGSAVTSLPPLPPPKITLEDLLELPGLNLSSKDGLLSAPGSPLREALSPHGIGSPPDSPAFSVGSSSMMAPPSPTADSSRPKKLNPFVDLLETEKTYVDTLSGIIRVWYFYPL